jgi:hypothetical protein
MKGYTAAFAGAIAAGLFAAAGLASPPGASPAAPAAKLVAHEWGTFTSFSGADGVPVGFRPDNSGLPEFVYRETGDAAKDVRLARGGTISMETPIIYFYADRATRASVRVDFPCGWVTEWYPASARGLQPPRGERGIRWDVRVVPGDDPQFPRGKTDNAYFRARETDAAPVEVEVDAGRRGDVAIQREKFLFYRGVGTFPPPVTAKALGHGTVRVSNAAGRMIDGLVLVAARGGKVGFRALPALAAVADAEAVIPDPAGSAADLADHLVRGLSAAGLYPKEARAMVRTWGAAWFGEDGTRVLYVVPRARTDELLPLTIDPKPAAVERVLVGRHEFLTPEQEADAERQVERARATGAELGKAGRELAGFGRFAPQARAIAEKRLGNRSAGR